MIMGKRTSKKVSVFNGHVSDGERTIEEIEALGKDTRVAKRRSVKKISVDAENTQLIDPELVQANALVEKLMVSANLTKQQSLDVVSVLNNMA